ncbi:MAG: sugar-transfer associated ATP-grasp domain-containing protein [Bryobacteraceae bacterium]
MSQAQAALKKRIFQLFHLSSERSKEGHLPLATQILEMAVLKLRHGIGPSYYHTAGFWRKEIPWRDKVNHLGSAAYLKQVDVLNPVRYQKLSQNKIAEKAILGLFRIPTPRFMGYLHPVVGRCASGYPLTSCADLERLIRSEPVEKICFKLIEGWGGRGFIAARVIREDSGIKLQGLFQSEVLSLQDFCEKVLEVHRKDGRVVEEYLEQHESYKVFNPSSVNTLRLWVIRSEDQPSKTIGGYLRMGRAGSLVDNQSSGGIVAPVDLDTGILYTAMDGNPTRKMYPVHPDHGAQIEGAKLDLWKEAKELGERTLMVFPNIHFAGFDIAMGMNGPAILELNVMPDLEGAAFVNLPTAALLRQ